MGGEKMKGGEMDPTDIGHNKNGPKKKAKGK